ncbi:MAG: DHH family phosphoesterase [Candidatus Diapherotrites archaeon]|nr:DHH family phosphoesterase [Candidatus Diapherotrites archaeon]
MELKPINPALLDAFDRYAKGLSAQDRIGIIFDDDSDGFSAALIVCKAIERLRGRKPDYYVSERVVSHDRFDGVVEELRAQGINKIISVDAPLDNVAKEKVRRLEEFAEVLVMDHHKMYEDLNSSRMTFLKPQLIWETESSSYPTCKFAFDLFSRVVDLNEFEWVACIGIVGDSAYNRWKEFVDKNSAKEGWKKEENIFDSGFGVISKIIYAIQVMAPGRMMEFFRFANSVNNPTALLYSPHADLLKEMDREVAEGMNQFHARAEQYPELELIWFEVRPRHSIKSLLINRISHELHPNKTVLLVQDLGGVKLNVSGRRQDFKVRVNDLLEEAVKGLEGSSGGGHIPAAAGVFMRKDLPTVKKRVMDLLKSGKCKN